MWPTKVSKFYSTSNQMTDRLRYKVHNSKKSVPQMLTFYFSLWNTFPTSTTETSSGCIITTQWGQEGGAAEPLAGSRTTALRGGHSSARGGEEHKDMGRKTSSLPLLQLEDFILFSRTSRKIHSALNQDHHNTTVSTPRNTVTHNMHKDC